MGGTRTDGHRAGVAAVVAALLLGTAAAGGAASAVPGPDLELEWEVGRAGTVWDGDTLQVEIERSSSPYSGSQRVRMVGVQAPETARPGLAAECGAAEAKAFLRDLAPTGTPLQLRAQRGTSFDSTNGRARLVRSVYAQDEEGNWYDLSRRLVGSGRALWFPANDAGEHPEWAHNLEYRVLTQEAQDAGRGLWARDACGPWRIPDLDIRLWAKYYGTERVYVENNGRAPIDLSGWIVRDAAISGYRTLPAGTVVAPGEVREVFAGDMNLNNLPADNPAFRGDAVYLMEPAGDTRTGNLRAWFPYPCNPDDCTDPLAGAIQIGAVGTTPPATRAPSPPGAVRATASTDGSGSIGVSWAHSTDPGGPELSYTVTARPVGGVASTVTATGVPGTTARLAGLRLGVAHEVSVRAVSGGGQSVAVAASAAVAPVGPPGVPGQPVAEPREGAAIVSWPAASTGGLDGVGYRVTAVEDTSRSCTTDGATSCVVQGLADGSPHTFTVRATNALGTSAPSSPSAPVTPGAAQASPDALPGRPTAVTAIPGNGAAVVSWTPPAGSGAAITATTVQASGSPARTCTAPGGTTSCVVTGLTNGTAYAFTVRATSAAGTGPASDPSAAIRPSARPTTRTSPATAPAPVVDPWIGGQVVELRNVSDRPARLGGYGLWDAHSSRFPSGSAVENRAAYLFPPSTTLAAGQVLRVHLVQTPPPVRPADTSSLRRLFTGGAPFVDPGADFLEVAHLNGAQVACTSLGVSCRTARPQSAPTQPVGVTARTTPASVTVAWGAPISRGGLPISGYTATAYDTQLGGLPIRSCRTDGSGRSCSFPGAVGRRYWVEVVATNDAGTSGPSWRVLAAPRTQPGAPRRVTVSGLPGALTVGWAAAADNGAPITGYTASAYRTRTGGAPVGTCSTDGAGTGCTIAGVAGGPTYHVEVTATNRVGTGGASRPRTTGTPGPGAALTTYERRRVVVRWDPPPAAAGITGFEARVHTKASGGTLLGSCVAPAGATQCTTGRLKQRSRYFVDLVTTSAAGASVMKPRIVTGPPRKPSAPRVLDAAPNGRRVVVTWSPPRFTGYAPLRAAQVVLYSKAKGGSVRGRCAAAAPATTCTTGAVRKGSAWAAVRVQNVAGWSTWSKRAKVVVR